MATDVTDESTRPSPDVYEMSRAEVRRRSLAGLLFLTTSNVMNLGVGFVASLVLARLLTPNDFGIVAVGSTAVLVGGALSDGGLGAGMIRRQQSPTTFELRTLNGIQLTLALAVCLPAIAVSPLFGRTGAVTAIMIASLPLTMLQTPARILLYRNMQFDRQLAIDVGSQITLQAFAVIAVVLGAGVWGLATAQLAKAAVGTAIAIWAAGGFFRPSLSGWRRLLPLVRFGLAFQASWFTWVAREQGVNVIIGVVAGIGPLGIWTFTNRIFQLPSIAFGSLFVVGFPAMSNLLARGDDPGDLISRTVRRSAIAGVFVFPTFAAAAPSLVPSLFGERWRESAEILPLLSFSTLILGSVAVAATSYLSAVGRPGVVAWASGALGIVWCGTTALLLPFIGVAAIGIGNLLGGITEAAILDRATKRSSGTAPSEALGRPLVVGIVSGTIGWSISKASGGGLESTAMATAATLAMTLAGLYAFCQEDLRTTLRLVIGTVSSGISLRRVNETAG